jgi:hypothetical protein
MLVGILVIFGLYVFLTLNPKLTVTPVHTADPRAAFGVIFNLRNHGVAAIRDVSSIVCVNNSISPGSNGPETGSSNEPSGLGDLQHGDVVALPVENLTPVPPDSKFDLVFVIRFQPGWWFWPEERRFRFSGFESSDKTWNWNPVADGGPCG